MPFSADVTSVTNWSTFLVFPIHFLWSNGQNSHCIVLTNLMIIATALLSLWQLNWTPWRLVALQAFSCGGCGRSVLVTPPTGKSLARETRTLGTQTCQQGTPSFQSLEQLTCGCMAGICVFVGITVGKVPVWEGLHPNLDPGVHPPYKHVYQHLKIRSVFTKHW